MRRAHAEERQYSTIHYTPFTPYRLFPEPGRVPSSFLPSVLLPMLLVYHRVRGAVQGGSSIVGATRRTRDIQQGRRTHCSLQSR